MFTRPVFLLGMMGAGKTSVGRELASRHGATFIDLDARIERVFGAGVAQLFELGEAYFRACERAALDSLVAEPGFRMARAVVATGGGVVTDAANMATMAAAGRLVYLRANVQTLCQRLSTPGERSRRPLLADNADALTQRLTELLQARAAAYARACVVVDASGSVPEVASLVERALATEQS
ncbi:Shikimate kinase I [Enhygromyxa salina]|uniref:Shikimate kinase n=1 Tax=Enhygromyxa salina TaxID=215803 RepID=A0A0C2D521_9BACT|nr:shikimate kinase [Enhygromyxa salina]KIG18251.1 Shikimate kinase I [Enhygromyxa salina]